jgi:tRNA dimethylallyltransferase
MAPVVVLGPTASGKSDVAMAAALAVQGTQIVAVDAMQVYRGMDIGTAKPTVADRATVPHHGLDLAVPTDSFSVVDYRTAYDRFRPAIPGRPLLVAGTGLYLTAVLDRLDLPGEWPDVRAALEAELDAGASLVTLHERLAALDPVAAQRVERSNRRRIVRALEVTIGGGRPFSSYGPGVAAYPPTAAALIGMRWRREVLRARVARRVKQMMGAGLLAEVARLAATGLSPTARQALGYKELLDHLEGRCPLDEAVAAIATRTGQFAVRQERWFRRDGRIRWIDIDRDPVAEVVPAVIDALRA